MEASFKFFAALVLIWINGIAAHPMETGGNETTSTNVTTMEVECPGVPPRYYGELNCTAVFENPQDRCPARWICDHFKESDTDMCYFRGESIAPNTTLNDTGNPCDIGCTCQLEGPFAEYNVSKMAVFRCAIVDCPLEELSGWDENGDPRNCVPKKRHDQCCATETVCVDGSDDEGNGGVDSYDKDKKEEDGEAKSVDDKIPEKKVPKKLATCVTADNQTYIEGQEFYLEDLPCKVCICQPGYTAGESGEPWCREVRCGTVLGHTRQIREGCAPLYYGTSRCCPIGFHCPQESDTVISDVLVKIAPNPEKSCEFGDMILRIGDRLATRPDEKCIECECQVPPYLSCQMKPDC